MRPLDVRRASVASTPNQRMHLVGCAVALALLSAGLVAGTRYARWQERDLAYVLAPRQFAQKNQGRALQAAALDRSDLLPIYGSSELDQYFGPFHGGPFFSTAPTGFALFTVGKEGTTSLHIVQQLASLGASLRERKVAISISPSWYTYGVASNPDYYAGSFSRLHANALAFSPDLSYDLRSDVARRMLQFPDSLQSDPLLRFALERLAGGSLLDRVGYALVFPLGQLQSVVLRLQDHWEVLASVGRQANASVAVAPESQPLDWDAVLAQADRESRERADNNPFGFDRDLYARNADKLQQQRRSRSSAAFQRALDQSIGWTDLDLLLRELRELGARPLLLSPPLPGTFYDFWGVYAPARQAYYDRLRQTVRRYGVPLVSFDDHDGDRLFVVDERSHLSQKGWAQYDRVLDAFYHDRLGA
jgi:D-alanine transfer protein